MAKSQSAPTSNNHPKGPSAPHNARSSGTTREVPTAETTDTAGIGDVRHFLHHAPLPRKAGPQNKTDMGRVGLPVHETEHRLQDDVRPFSETAQEPLFWSGGPGPSDDRY